MFKAAYKLKCCSGLMPGSLSPAELEGSVFCLEICLLHIYSQKFISHIIQLWNIWSTWKKNHYIILQYLETSSYSSLSRKPSFGKHMMHIKSLCKEIIIILQKWAYITQTNAFLPSDNLYTNTVLFSYCL